MFENCRPGSSELATALLAVLALLPCKPARAADAEPLAIINSVLVGGQPSESITSSQLEVVRAADGSAVPGLTGEELYAEDRLRSSEGVQVILRFLQDDQESFADVLVDAGSDVRIRGPRAIGLSLGRILAMINGFFEVLLPDELTLGAQGTEFEVRIDEAGEAELLVLDGEVRIQRPEALAPATAPPPPAGIGAFWGFRLQTGGAIKTETAIPTHNACAQTQSFGVRTAGNLPWLAVGALEAVAVPPGELGLLTLVLAIDARGIAAGTYRDKILVDCLDCAESGCDGDLEVLEVSIEVSGEVTGETVVQPLQKAILSGAASAPQRLGELEVTSTLNWSNDVLIAAQPSYAAAHEPPRLGSPQERGEVFRKARYNAIWKQSAASRVRLGDVYSDWGEGRKAVVEYEGASASQPRSAAWLTRLGAASRQAGDLEKAGRYLEAAVEQDPQSAAAKNALGNLHMDLAAVARERGDLDLAEDEAKRSFGWFRRGKDLSATARTDSTRRAWLEGVTAANTARAQIELGKIAFEKGRLDEAAELYAASEGVLKEALDAYPQYPFAKLELGSLSQQQGRLAAQRGEDEASRDAYAKADEHYKEVISDHRDLAPAYVKRGTLLEDRASATSDPGEKERYQEEAAQEYKKSIRARPSYAPAYYQLGKASEAKNDTTLAKRYYGTYLKVEQREFQKGEKGHHARTWKGDLQVIGVAVPDLQGKTSEVARAILERLKLAVGAITYEGVDVAIPGTVIGQKPEAGTPLANGGPVDLVVATGRRVRVPGVKNQPLARAREQIRGKGFQVGAITERESCDESGRVLDQAPGWPSRRNQGTLIELVVSTAGPNAGPVPKLTTLPTERAKAALAEAGFRLGKVKDKPSDKRLGTVLEQRPASETVLKAGCPVEITVAGLAEVPDLIGESERAAVRTLKYFQGVHFVTLGEVTYQDTRQAEPGTVVSQSPGPKARVRPGTRINLVIAREPRVIE